MRARARAHTHTQFRVVDYTADTGHPHARRQGRGLSHVGCGWGRIGAATATEGCGPGVGRRCDGAVPLCRAWAAIALGSPTAAAMAGARNRTFWTRLVVLGAW